MDFREEIKKDSDDEMFDFMDKEEEKEKDEEN